MRIPHVHHHKYHKMVSLPDDLKHQIKSVNIIRDYIKYNRNSVSINKPFSTKKCEYTYYDRVRDSEHIGDKIPLNIVIYVGRLAVVGKQTGWHFPAITRSDILNKLYIITGEKCTCPDFRYRKYINHSKCKHLVTWHKNEEEKIKREETTKILNTFFIKDISKIIMTFIPSEVY
jgi:predicted nucleic acid-binding Zn finger protein